MKKDEQARHATTTAKRDRSKMHCVVPVVPRDSDPVFIAHSIKLLGSETDQEREAKLAVRASILLGMSLRRVLMLDFRRQVSQFLTSRSVSRSLCDADESCRTFTASNRSLFRAVTELLVCAGNEVTGRVDGRLLHACDRDEARTYCLTIARRQVRSRTVALLRYRRIRKHLIACTHTGRLSIEKVALFHDMRMTSRGRAQLMVRACINYHMSTGKPFSLRDLGLAGKGRLRAGDATADQTDSIVATLLRDLPRRNVDAMFFRYHQLMQVPIELVVLQAERNFEAGDFFYWPMADDRIDGPDQAVTSTA